MVLPEMLEECHIIVAFRKAGKPKKKANPSATDQSDF